ncbi:MFS transporter [Intrasporangium oryzae NRRL B-24470]|uniref:MFS transporter n=1 Tax=Intrasporangium oryzae NRRL B-24470 TaxID=1386089 RepID=W9GI93_9MICO|nr:MFS transporter [Intrasporangium oryzae]EWT03599.1 MFS transporter [Intrasporangium oryzae NRRL B-24470]
MSPIDSYRRLVGLTGPTYVVVAFLARMPLAMSQLGVLLLVAGTTGSYGAGGACAGALAVANALGAPLWGSRADRLGQRRVVAVQSVAGALALAALLVIVSSGLPWGVAAVASAVAGLLMPQIGPLARVRWRPITAQSGPHQARLVDAAFSYEGAADEASFVLGPAIVGLGVSVASPTTALTGAAVALAAFGTWFALHETATLTHAATARARSAAARLLTPALVVLCVAQLLIGAVFGSVQTGTSVLATDAGSPGLTGYFHALLGIGSVVAGLAIAALPARFALTSRLRWFAVGLLVLAAPLLLVGSLPALAPALLVLGCTVAPYMITTFTLGERVTPPSRTGAAMTLLASATGLGYALGAAVAGRLADWGGHTPAYAVTVAAGALAVLLSWAARPVLARAEGVAAAEAVPVPAEAAAA